MTFKNIFQCPKCNHSGISLAAMHYKETQEWHKSGTFSGSEIGTFGIGIGNGSYEETGKIATKRANHFAKPEPYSIPIINLILPFILIFILINLIPFIMDFILKTAPLSTSAEELYKLNKILNIVSFFNYYISPIFCLLIFYKIISTTFQANKEEEDLNNNIYPQDLKRYNEIRYCENCNTIFDNHNNYEDANSIGMKKMMLIDSET